jgi:hypothetical protein
MKLRDPFSIGSRLLPALKIGDAWLSLEHVGYGQYGKACYRWYIDLPDGSEHSAADLCGHGTTQAMFGTLLSFLGACGEGHSYQSRTGRESENADLFPSAVAEWAYQHSDEIDSLREEIESPDAVLIEEA